jgi:hypothetical protein
MQDMRAKLLNEEEQLNEVTFKISDGYLQNFFNGGSIINYSKRAKQIEIALNGEKYYVMDQDSFDSFIKDADDYGYDTSKIEYLQQPTEEVNEMSVSGGGASAANFTSGTGEQYASKKAFEKESKGGKERGTGKGYIYKDLWEGKYFATNDNRLIASDEASWQKMYGALTNILHNIELTDIRPYIKGWNKATTQVKFKNAEALQKFKSYLEKSVQESENIEETVTPDDYKKAQSLLDKIKDTNPKIYNAILLLISDIEPHPYSDMEKMVPQALAENYGRFKNETKTRGKADQFHQAIREVRKKVQEINRVFEYVNRLKNELNEGESGLKYKKHTEAAIQKIKEMVNELNSKVKKFK